MTVLERGYTLHEATFELLLALVAVRRAQGWAWWTCWIGLSAGLG